MIRNPKIGQVVEYHPAQDGPHTHTIGTKTVTDYHPDRGRLATVRQKRKLGKYPQVLINLSPPNHGTLWVSPSELKAIRPTKGASHHVIHQTA